MLYEISCIFSGITNLFLLLLDILNEDKTMNRRALGRKVFGNQVKWPVQIMFLAHNDIALHVSTIYQTCCLSGRSG